MQTTNTDLVNALRTLFADGATPSLLIRRLFEETTQEEAPTTLLSRYFSEAFGNKAYQIPVIDDPDFQELRYADLNDELLHQLVQGLPAWKETPECEGESWCDEVQAIDLRARKAEFDPYKDPYLSQVWDKLDRKAQAYITHQILTARVKHEKIRILSKLAERLQQKVFHLEKRVQAFEANQPAD